MIERPSAPSSGRTDDDDHELAFIRIYPGTVGRTVDGRVGTASVGPASVGLRWLGHRGAMDFTNLALSPRCVLAPPHSRTLAGLVVPTG
jgi:hypothetical protein